MSVGFDLADRRAAEDALIARVVKRARNNAQALAAASGSKLDGVKHISYNSQLGSMDRLCYASAADFALGAPAGSADSKVTVLEPEPIEVECSVDVEWWRVWRGPPGRPPDFVTEIPFVKPGARG